MYYSFYDDLASLLVKTWIKLTNDFVQVFLVSKIMLWSFRKIFLIFEIPRFFPKIIKVSIWNSIIILLEFVFQKFWEILLYWEVYHMLFTLSIDNVWVVNKIMYLKLLYFKLFLWESELAFISMFVYWKLINNILFL